MPHVEGHELMSNEERRRMAEENQEKLAQKKYEAGMISKATALEGLRRAPISLAFMPRSAKAAEEQENREQVQQRTNRLIGRAAGVLNDGIFDKPKGDPRFHAILQEMAELHDRKQQDYGSEGDPLANIRASEKFGVPAWGGALIRLNDKLHRLSEFLKKGSLANESAEDSMLDIAVYAILCLILYREESEGS